jgi:hypothetical protein
MDSLFEAFMKYYVFINVQTVDRKENIMTFEWRGREFNVSELTTGLYHLKEITGTLEEYGSAKAIIEALFR